MNGMCAYSIGSEIEAAYPARGALLHRKLVSFGDAVEPLFQNAGLPESAKGHVDMVSDQTLGRDRRWLYLRTDRNFRLVIGGLLSGADDLSS